VSFLLFWLMACGGPTRDCIDNGGCYEGEACVNEQCVSVDCVTSSECALEQFCDPASYVCSDGCLEDVDCLAGDECNVATGQCESAGCRATELDCPIGEFCETDESSADFGVCYDDPRPHCELCDATENNTCSGASECFIVEAGDSCQNDADCPSGWTCDRLDVGGGKVCHEDRCLVACDLETDSCPSGFQCADVTGAGDIFCSADCGWLDDNGYL
jgi:hypothetical protein